MTSTYLRKWLGVPKGFRDLNLFSQSSPASLQLEEEFKTCQVRPALLIRDAKDHTFHNMAPEVSKKMKWSPQAAIVEAESRLRTNKIVGIIARGRSGLGSFRTTKWTDSDATSKRHQIVEEVQKREEEDCQSRQPRSPRGMDQVGNCGTQKIILFTATNGRREDPFFLPKSNHRYPAIFNQPGTMEDDRRPDMPSVQGRSSFPETCT